jgi:hypothetical protein
VFNDGLNEKAQATSQFIGRKVAGLGFEKCRVGSKGQAGFYWDEKLIGRLKARYFPVPASTLSSVTSETPETSAAMDKSPPIVSSSSPEVTEVKPIKQGTIYIYDSAETDAFATLTHEIVEFKLKEVTRVYRVLVNNLTDGYEKLAYQRKENFIEFIARLMELKKEDLHFKGMISSPRDKHYPIESHFSLNLRTSRFSILYQTLPVLALSSQRCRATNAAGTT